MLTAVLFGLTACSSMDNAVVETNLPDVPEWDVPDYSSVKCNTPVFLSQSIDPEVRNGVGQYLTNITELDNAEVAVVKPEDIGTYSGKLLDLFNRGGLIVVARPTGVSFQDFVQKYGIIDFMPFDASQPVLLFATDKSLTSYTLYGSNPQEENVEDDYFKERIFNFFSWLKQRREQDATVITRATTDIGNKTGWESDGGMHIYQNFEVQMNNEVFQNGDKSKTLNTTGSIEVCYHVYPVYSYEYGGSNAGDYYIVTTDVTARNGKFYRPYSSVGIGNNILIAGYFMKELVLVTRLLRADDKGNSEEVEGVSFVSNPTPETGNGPQFTASYELALQGPLSFERGLDGGGVGFGANFNSSFVRYNKDLRIEQSCDMPDEVYYRYVVENFDFGRSISSTHFLDDAIPEIARTDFTSRSAWCWKVPAKTNGVADNSTQHFCIKTNLQLQYGSYYLNLGGGSGQSDWNYNGISSIVNLPAPDRRPFGYVELENQFEDPIDNISLWKSDEHPGEGEPYSVVEERCRKESSIRFAVPAGNYHLEYDVINTWANCIHLKKKFENVEVKVATDEANATNLSTSDSEPVPYTIYNIGETCLSVRMPPYHGGILDRNNIW